VDKATKQLDGSPVYKWKISPGTWESEFAATPRVKEAIMGAYPMPKNFREAFAEYKYWEARAREICDMNDIGKAARLAP
jgi:hypothetical protein